MGRKATRRDRGSADRSAGPRRPDRKTLQLCEQVRQALEYALSGESDDDLLRMLYVARVDPAPNADRLLVTVVPLAKDEPPDPAAVMKRLLAHAGPLRASVANAISRRKVPDLLYNYAEIDPLAVEAGGIAGSGEEE
jgi:ribosome-binding factor A